MVFSESNTLFALLMVVVTPTFIDDIDDDIDMMMIDVKPWPDIIPRSDDDDVIRVIFATEFPGKYSDPFWPYWWNFPLLTMKVTCPLTPNCWSDDDDIRYSWWWWPNYYAPLLLLFVVNVTLLMMVLTLHRISIDSPVLTIIDIDDDDDVLLMMTWWWPMTLLLRPPQMTQFTDDPILTIGDDPVMMMCVW